MENNILVCTSNIKNSEKLIERGTKIASAFNGKCKVLTISKAEYSEYDYNAFIRKNELNKIVKKYNAELLYINQRGKKLCKIIKEVVNENNIGHIILGQPVRTKWNIVMEGSLINELFTELDDVDLHIVEVSKEIGHVEERYENGSEVQLINFKGDLESLFANQPAPQKGIFYQSSDTEFVYGLLKVKQVVDKEEIDVFFKVVNGEIVSKI